MGNKQTNAFEILHTYVGPFPQGRIVSRDQLESAGATINRLLNLSPPAIKEVDEPVSEEPLPETTEAQSLKAEGKINLPIGEGERGEKSETEKETEEEEEGLKLEDMTTKELRDRAAELGGIDKASSMSKGELIEAIREIEKKK